MSHNVTAQLRVGLTGEQQTHVEPDDTALRWGSGGVEVLSTPQLVALLESVALSIVDPLLPDGWITVGTRVDIQHLSATPVGMSVRARAVLTAIQERHLTFEVTAHDRAGIIARGTHERVAVNRRSFTERATKKLDAGNT
ncbi:MAG: thioesterase family protein [Anaerolineae bacterium]